MLEKAVKMFFGIMLHFCIARDSDGAGRGLFVLLVSAETQSDNHKLIFIRDYYQHQLTRQCLSVCPALSDRQSAIFQIMMENKLDKYSYVGYKDVFLPVLFVQWVQGDKECISISEAGT